MEDIREKHEQVLQFLLDWRSKQDKDLVFTLRRRPIERLESGMWFLGNEYYLAFSFWTGTDWVNKTQNIYIEINNTGQFRLKFSGRDDRDKASVLEETAIALGGFSRVGKMSIWVKEYEGSDYLKNLELFLTEDRKRIDAVLNIQRRSGFNLAFNQALNRLNETYFLQQLQVVQQYRQPNPNASIEESTPYVKPLKIKQLTVSNVGLFEKCSIQFGKRATCFIGENGGGKTTLLRAAALGLVGTGSPLIDTVKELQNLPRIIGVDEKYLFRYAGDGSIQVEYVFNETNFENGKANLIPYKSLPDTGSVEFGGDRIEPEGFGLPVEDEGTDGDGELPTLVIGYPQRYGRKPDGTDVKKRSPNPNAYDIIPLIHDTEDNRIESLKLWISETWNQGETYKPRVTTLFRIITDVLTQTGGAEFQVQLKSAISPRKIVVTTPFNPEGIPFDMLSTGLSNLFGWIGHLISRMHEAYSFSENPTNESAIVLVDEVDNYLHPAVQARAIPVLLAEFPNVQFIFTSHSPVVLATLQNEGVKAYRVEKGEAIEIEHFYGRTIQDILLEEYGINKRPAANIQYKIDEMFRAVDLDEKVKAQAIFDELQPILGDSDAAIKDASYDLN
jgi:hypothetical protein